ncbi:hypothetical protein GCM10017600_46610 [Streptosporangium carneum]|uniref:Uncharacterized protein n=1 Tax=Streptosporangium carneum TaxID=47481 RepID=A0A9W6I5D5_9ACTN|nr:hypothetical protein GCM10017600_46610 [Streptosporangium carneum]
MAAARAARRRRARAFAPSFLPGTASALANGRTARTTRLPPPDAGESVDSGEGTSEAVETGVDEADASTSSEDSSETTMSEAPGAPAGDREASASVSCGTAEARGSSGSASSG